MNNLKVYPFCISPTCQACVDCIILCGLFYWLIFGLLVPTGYSLNTTCNLNIAADNVQALMNTVYPFSNENNAPYHKAQILCYWFLEHFSEFFVLPWLPKSPHLNPVKHRLDVSEQYIHIMGCVKSAETV